MKLLIVEPDEVQTEVYQLAFADQFDILQVSTFEQAKTTLETENISIVLTEWQIGEEFASTLCGETDPTVLVSGPLIVVVSSDSREESMKQAFQSGVSHYITKPYNAIAFKKTFQFLKSQVELLGKLRLDKSKNRETARTALSQAAIYGTGMEITAELNRAIDIHAMAKTVLSTLRKNDVHAALQFRHSDEMSYIDTDLKPCDETTRKVFDVLHNQGRIYRFGHRMIINDEHVSLLVKHVTKNDPIVYDAILDMGAKLVPAINARFTSIRQQQALVQTHEDVEKILEKMHQSVLNLGHEKKQIIQAVSGKIHVSFHQLEFTEEQEAFFIDLVEKELLAREESSELVDLDTMMTGISQRLKERIEALSCAAEHNEQEDYQDVEFF